MRLPDLPKATTGRTILMTSVPLWWRCSSYLWSTTGLLCWTELLLRMNATYWHKFDERRALLFCRQITMVGLTRASGSQWGLIFFISSVTTPLLCRRYRIVPVGDVTHCFIRWFLCRYWFLTVVIMTNILVASLIDGFFNDAALRELKVDQN